MKKKFGAGIGTLTQVSGLPYGFSVRKHKNRIQPYTLWHNKEVIFFSDSLTLVIEEAKKEAEVEV